MSELPEPRANPVLLGHEAAERCLRETASSGRMHHAWLITGKPGIGRATLAYRFARWRLAAKPDADSLALEPGDPVFRRVAAGTHADLLTVERGWDEKRRRRRSEILVEDVRAIGNFLRLTPAEGGWRVVVLDGAEEMNRNAANALLKLLEEPPPRALLLLICSAPGRLLATLRSRCRHLALAQLQTGTVESLLARALPGTAPAEVTRLAALSEGSVGRALQLAEEEGVAIADLVQSVLERLPGVKVLQAHEVADQLVRSETGFATFMELTRATIAAAVGGFVRGQAEPWQARLVDQRPVAEWCDVWQALGRLQDETERFHLDKRYAIVSGIAMLSRS